MDLDRRLQNVTVLGAAGKMGSGIALLLAQEMTRLRLLPENQDKVYILNLIDISDTGLAGLRAYLKAQLVKAGEKSVNVLRQTYAARHDLVENGDIINQYVDDVQAVMRFGTDLHLVKGSHLVFEAILENRDTKVETFKQIETIVGSEPFYLTNTSSIPIGVLDQGAKLGGRIIGYHFYNPPAVQKLVELIAPATTRPEVKEVSLELAKRLRKTIVPANDVAGFIGNGHFMRDILHAASAVEKLESQFGEPGAIYVMNRVSQDFLLRPMGIFQLVDYVGVEVCQLIMSVMSEHIKGETLRSALIDRMVEKHVIGGQNPDGSQKDGFLKYERGRPVGVYDLKKPGYVLFEEDAWGRGLDEKIGALPPGHSPWKALLGDTKREEKLKSYFANLATCQTLGCTLAQAYMRRSKEIGEHLVSMRVANSPQDVNNVLTNGFFHLYGPVNDYV